MEPVQIGSRFKSIEAYAPGQVLVPPSENVNGIVIRTASLNATGVFMLTTGTAAPVNYSDSTKPVLLTAGSPAAGATASVTLPYPIAIPAGMGLWTTGGGVNNRAYITYDVL